jgi:hypothetical protein
VSVRFQRTLVRLPPEHLIKIGQGVAEPVLLVTFACEVFERS